MNIEAGAVYSVTYPFVKRKISLWDEDGLNEFDSWVPGVDYELVPPGDSIAIAHGEGYMLLKVIDKHKPGKYPERIFYIRKFVDPNGKMFGKNNLHICVASKFKRLATSYQYDYEIEEAPTKEKRT